MTDVTHFILLSLYINTISMTKGMIFRFALARSKKIMNDTPEVFYTYKKCCFCVTDVTRARNFPMNLISLSKLCVDCL